MNKKNGQKVSITHICTYMKTVITVHKLSKFTVYKPNYH